MSSLARIFCSMVLGAVFGYLGFILAAIFVPLLFPESLGSVGPDRYALLVMLFLMLLCAAVGFALMWKITARWAEE